MRRSYGIETGICSRTTGSRLSGRAGGHRSAVLAAALAAALLMIGAVPAVTQQPNLVTSTTFSAPPGQLTSLRVDSVFSNAGTNAIFTRVEFSTLDYYESAQTGISSSAPGVLDVKVKTSKALNALTASPASPFTVTAAVRMTNESGQTASGLITFRTEYVQDATDSAPTRPQPVLAETPNVDAAPGVRVTVVAGDVFDNAGTNPTFTSAMFSASEYLDVASSGLQSSGSIAVRVKTADELNALAEPPASPFTFLAEVEMTNDEEDTATGTITFETTYERSATPTPAPPSTPTISVTEAVSAPVGVLVRKSADELFDNAGTNPTITGAEFSTTDYYNVHEVTDGSLKVQAKNPKELSVLPSPPPSPFTVTVDVTMSNDEDETASGKITFETTYEQIATAVPEQPSTPTISATETITAPVGVLVRKSADELFDNAGTNPTITGAEFSTTDYYSIHEVTDGRLWVHAKTAEELNDLPSPPPSPFTVTVDVTMSNDEDESASGKITFETTYEQAATTPSQPSTPTFSITEKIAAPPGEEVTIHVDSAFDNRGTNAVFLGAGYYPTDYIYKTTFGADVYATTSESISVTVMTNAQLNALDNPPPSPFTFNADVTMTNDEGQTASGTITFETTYARTTSAPTNLGDFQPSDDDDHDS